MKNTLKTLCLFCVLSSSVKAVEFKSYLGAGVDSNPHQLSDALSPDQEIFARALFESRSSFADMLYWDVKVQKDFYPDDSRADKLHIGADLKFEHDFDLWDTNYQYFIGLNYAQLDKTFVSRETGAVATLNGVSFADRYDRDDQGSYLGLKFATSETFNYSFTYYVTEHDYVDFQVAGIDSLDNENQKFIFGINQNTVNEGVFYFKLGFQNWQYLSRQDRDFDGNEIAGTNLELLDIISMLGYTYNPDKKTRWDFVFNFTNRYSNGTDYYESERAKVDIIAEHRFADYHLLTSRLTYQTYYFDDDFDQPYEFFEADQVEKRGFNIFFEYTWIIATLFETNLGLYANIEGDIYDSPDNNFDYQQVKAAVGIRWALD